MMKFNWKVGAAVAVGAGLAYAVYRAEREKSEQALPTGLKTFALQPGVTMQLPVPETKETILGNLSPTQATGSAMIGGFALYAITNLGWDLVKEKIVSRA